MPTNNNLQKQPKCLLLTQNGHPDALKRCLLWRVKRTRIHIYGNDAPDREYPRIAHRMIRPVNASPSTAGPVAGCNNNWSTWGVGTRLQYDFTKTLYLGVDFLYQGFNTATGLNGTGFGGGTNTLGSVLAGQLNTTTTTSGVNLATPLKDMQNLAVTVRIHKDFLP